MVNRFLWCLLLLAVAHVISINAAPSAPAAPGAPAAAEDNGSEGLTEEKLNRLFESDKDDAANGLNRVYTTDDDDGEETNETTVADRDCRIQITLAKTKNGSSYVVDDLEDGIQLAVISSSNDTCLVHRSPGSKKSCQAAGNADKDTQTNTRERKAFIEVATLNPADLPEYVRNLCKGRVIKLIEEADMSSTDITTQAPSDTDVDTSAGRQKRAIRCCRLILYYRTCRRYLYCWYVLSRRYCRIITRCYIRAVPTNVVRCYNTAVTTPPC